jgi:pilus assembly protein CpaE
MAQLSAVVSTTDSHFRTHITGLLRSSSLSIAVTDERHIGSGVAPDVAIADIRSGSTTSERTLERLRATWPSTAIFAVAATNDPEQILQAMRAGANEFLAWPSNDDGTRSLDEAFRTALARTAERIRAAKGTEDRRASLTMSFFGAKGGVGTTTLAVNSAIDIARLSKRPTLIIDLHQFVGEVALFLGVRPRFTVVDAIDNLHRLDAEFLRELVTRHKTGLDILAGAEQVDRPGPQDGPALEQLLQVLSRFYEFIIIDAGPVTGPCAQVAVYGAEAIYVVANPDVPSIRNTQRLVDRVCQLGAERERVRVLLNRTSEQHVIAPKQIETALGQAVHQAFSSDYGTVSAALNSGVPLTLSNHSELAEQFSRFTRGILNTPEAEEPADRGRRRAHFLGLF